MDERHPIYIALFRRNEFDISFLSSISLQGVFDRSLRLIGHQTLSQLNREQETEGKCDWIASAVRGQVAYPSCFDNWDSPIESQPLLRLSGGPGLLQYKGDRYQLVISKMIGLMAKTQIQEDIPCKGPRNPLPAEKLKWQVKQGDGCLQLGMGLTGTPKTFSPMRALETACDSIFISTCSHSSEDPLPTDPSYSQTTFITPGYFGYQDDELEVKDRTFIVVVSGDDSLRFFALLCNRGAAVVRRSSCLKCCVDICRQYSDVLNHVIC